MNLKTFLSLFGFGLCLASVQPLPTPELSLSTDVKERLKLVKINGLHTIWDSDRVSSCNVKRPSKDKLNDGFFLKFSFDQYLCLMLHDVSLHYLEISSKGKESNAGLKQQNVGEILRETPDAQNFCKSMKEIELYRTDENREWVEHFSQLMKNLTECNSHCVADEGVYPLCAFVFWVNSRSNIIQHALTAVKGNDVAVSSNKNKPGDSNPQFGTNLGNVEVHALSNTGLVPQNTKKDDFSSGAHVALPKKSHIPVTTGTEGASRQEGGGSVNTVRDSGSPAFGGTAEDRTWPREPSLQMSRGQNTPTNMATNTLGGVPSSLLMGDHDEQNIEEQEPKQDSRRVMDIDDEGGRASETADDGDTPTMFFNSDGLGEDSQNEAFQDQGALQEQRTVTQPVLQGQSRKQEQANPASENLPKKPQPNLEVSSGALKKTAPPRQEQNHQFTQQQHPPPPPQTSHQQLHQKSSQQEQEPLGHHQSQQTLPQNQQKQPEQEQQQQPLLHPPLSAPEQPPQQQQTQSQQQQTQSQQQQTQSQQQQTQIQQQHDQQQHIQQTAEATQLVTPEAAQKPVKTSQDTQTAIADEGFKAPETVKNEEDAAVSKINGQRESTLGQGKDADYEPDDDAEPGEPEQEGSVEAIDSAGGKATLSGVPEISIKQFPGAEESHFFAYFMTMMILCIVGYLIFHNKQKILALALEGRSRRGTRRRPNTSGYRKLDSNLEEAVTSGCSSTSVTHVIY